MMKYCAVVLAVLSLLHDVALAQVEADDSATEIEELSVGAILDTDPNVPDVLVTISEYINSEDPDNEALRPALEEFFLVWLSENTEVMRSGNARRELAVSRQATVAMTIFWIAHVLLLLGISAAIYEFFQARRQRAVPEGVELSVEMSGIAVKTSLLGVVLFVSSVGFYFLYLKFVYPIQVL